MLKTIRDAWKIDDLRKKMLFTLFVILLYRLGDAIPVPYVNLDALSSYFEQVSSTVLGLINTMSGGSFSRATIFALSIQPYINASIIIQLLTLAIPALERMQKDEGEEGQKKLASITRYATVLIGLLQGYAYFALLKNNSLLVSDTGVWEAIVIILTFTSGSALIMWMGEQITEFGIGNGISIILFASIVARLPSDLYRLITSVSSGAVSVPLAIFMIIGALAMIVLIVFVSDAERRIPIQYSKRVVGRKVYGGQSTHLPMKVNMSGVLPIIFAQSIAMLPATVCAFKTSWSNSWVMKHVFDSTTWPYAIIYFLLIIFFSYFYSTIQFNPIEVANNLKKNGGFIPGFRPGRPTSEYIQNSLNKITLFGAIYLGIVAVAPIIVSMFSSEARSYGLALGGTSIIIVIGVALETVRAMEAQMVMRNYKGFLE
ncbi:MAG: preprotein translocase subunit SecY [Oscillospiraceae bacterium]